MPTPTWIGVLLAGTGNTLIGISYTLSKAAHNQVRESTIKPSSLNAENENKIIQQKEQKLPLSDDQNILNDSEDTEIRENGIWLCMKQRTWWYSVSMLIIGEILNFLAYGAAPTSVVAPLGTMSIVSGAISGYLGLREPIHLKNLFGLIISIVGTTIIVIASKSSESHLLPEDIISAWTQFQFAIFNAITLVVAFTLIYMDIKGYGNRYMIVRVGLTAIFGGYTVLATKSLSSLLTLKIKFFFSNWISYIILLIGTANAVLGIIYTNKALSSFDSTKVLPAEFSAFTMTAVIGSAILYHDFDFENGTTILDICLFVGGCLVIFIGVWFLTRDPIATVTQSDQEPLLSTSAEQVNGWSVEKEPLSSRPSLLSPPVFGHLQYTTEHRHSTILGSHAQFAEDVLSRPWSYADSVRRGIFTHIKKESKDEIDNRNFFPAVPQVMRNDEDVFNHPSKTKFLIDSSKKDYSNRYSSLESQQLPITAVNIADLVNISPTFVDPSAVPSASSSSQRGSLLSPNSPTKHYFRSNSSLPSPKGVPKLQHLPPFFSSQTQSHISIAQPSNSLVDEMNPEAMSTTANLARHHIVLPSHNGDPIQDQNKQNVNKTDDSSKRDHHLTLSQIKLQFMNLVKK